MVDKDDLSEEFCAYVEEYGKWEEDIYINENLMEALEIFLMVWWK